MDTAGANIAAFLATLRQAEGTAAAVNPYAVCYGYRHQISNFADHPANTGEWKGERLPDAMCINAGFGPGCVSTAAGAYQIIRPTWNKVRAALGLGDFSATSQDAAAVELIRRRGALEDVKAGQIATAIDKCRNEWASLPGNYAKQGQRSQADLLVWYYTNGGVFA
ncbi:glycoside hydrolase family 104 protein [Rhodoferax sp. 4810]|nr:glycoside hydrolase family 104 protein [Rhodoferax jenense]